MSTATTAAPVTATSTRVRVAVREVHETAFRALIAAGVSGGEASTAARAVLDAEITDGSGITALVAELHRLPVGYVPVALRRGAIDTVDDPARRGPLLLGPLAVDLTAAGEHPVLLPGAVMSTVLERIAVSAARRDGTALALGPVCDGEIAQWVVAMPDAALRHVPDRDDALASEAGCTEAITNEPGVLIRRLDPAAVSTSGRTARVAATFEEASRAALVGGLWVDSAPWRRAYRVARQFLVPDH